MRIALPPRLQKVVDALLRGDGRSARELRRRVMEHVAALTGAPIPAADLPPELEPYVRKVALHAYRVTDEDVAALQASGYSEDAIFELTAAAALSAGVTRMERGLAALRGAPAATPTEHDPDASTNS